MNIEPTQEQLLRNKDVECAQCGNRIRIGPNYPIGVPLPRTLEIWCSGCKVINTHSNPLYFPTEK